MTEIETGAGWRDATCGSAAAYVLGALDARERADFEAHLAGCPSCRTAVGELSGLPALLSRVDPGEVEDVLPPTPDTLLPRLLAEVRRNSRRRRLTTWGAGVAAAALLAVLAGVLAVRGGNDTGPALAMHPLVSSSPIHATAALQDETWGTRIRLECSYEGYPAARQQETYRLVVTNQKGDTRTVSTWTAVPGQVSDITGSVEWKRPGIRTLAVEEADGTTVLNLALG